jgi:trehalose synthase
VIVWHINSTAVGGGVAELLTALERSGNSTDYEHRRHVTTPDQDVFAITKSLHHRLHGIDVGDLPDDEAAHRYEEYGTRNAEAFMAVARGGDLVVLHDPQTLPMAPALVDAGFSVAWRCHVGTTVQNQISLSTWNHLSKFFTPSLRFVFSDRELVPPILLGDVTIIAPSVDLSSPKNEFLSPSQVTAVLEQAGLGAAPRPADGNRVHLVSGGPLGADPVIVQVSRWDPLKDMSGVLRAYADSQLPRRAQLVLCGPSPRSIVDDPEAADVWNAVEQERSSLPSPIRRRVHLVCPDPGDRAGNARLVNALQRRADVVTQKSLQEGFGLTVTEAMAKGRPVIASRVGGIAKQIIHGETGLLVDDPRDHASFAGLMSAVLADSEFAGGLGRSARRHVRERFSLAREVRDHHALYAEMLRNSESGVPR